MRPPSATLANLRRAPLLAALACAPWLHAPSAPASPVTVETMAETDALDATASPFRGSNLTYRNIATALTFDRAGELTYNPTWRMALEVAPRFWFDETLSLGLRFDVSREITDDDFSTFDNETFVSDLSLGLSARHLATIPGAEIDLSASLLFVFPTSKASQGHTMLLAVAPSVRLSRRFDVLGGLELAYGLGLTKGFHRFTTSERASPLIPGCFRGAGGCEQHLGTGVRNVSWRVTNTFELGVSLLPWLSLDVAVGVYTSILYGGAEDARVSHTPQEPTGTRHAMLYDMSLTARPARAFAVSLGALTINPQQRPDSSYYAPFVNRYTALYLDLRLDVGTLVADLSRAAP